jgi:hypothetical protein
MECLMHCQPRLRLAPLLIDFPLEYTAEEMDSIMIRPVVEYLAYEKVHTPRQNRPLARSHQTCELTVKVQCSIAKAAAQQSWYSMHS